MKKKIEQQVIDQINSFPDDIQRMIIETIRKIRKEEITIEEIRRYIQANITIDVFRDCILERKRTFVEQLIACSSPIEVYSSKNYYCDKWGGTVEDFRRSLVEVDTLYRASIVDFCKFKRLFDFLPGTDFKQIFYEDGRFHSGFLKEENHCKLISEKRALLWWEREETIIDRWRQKQLTVTQNWATIPIEYFYDCVKIKLAWLQNNFRKEALSEDEKKEVSLLKNTLLQLEVISSQLSKNV